MIGWFMAGMAMGAWVMALAIYIQDRNDAGRGAGGGEGEL